jgi:hypothetical protein
MGLSRSVKTDTTFAAWVGDSAFEAVSARLDSNATPLARAEVAAKLTDPSLLVEDIAWDSRRHRFL